MKKIGVACTTIFHYVHFKWIAKELSSNGFSVVYIIYTPRHVNERFERLEKFFRDNGIKYCSFEDLFNGKASYDIILAPYFLPGFQLLNPHIKKVRGLYGYAKDRWNYAEWNEGFDLVLSYGRYAEQRLSRYGRVVNIGHPRKRAAYAERLIDIHGKVFEKTNKSKPVLVYCPTWANLSSLNTFAQYIEDFRNKFNIIVKLHHGNVLSDHASTWQSIINTKELFLFDEQTDLFDLLYHADAVLSDHSGAIFDAMLFRKPIILIDIIDENINNTGLANLNNMQNVALYNREKKSFEELSLDIAVRQILPHAQKSKDLILLINNTLEAKGIPYEELLSELYSFEDNQAPKRAVQAINELLDLPVDREKKNESYFIIDSNKIIEFIEKNKHEHVSIWGAGEMGQIIYAWLKGQGYSIDRIYDVDNNKHGKVIDEIIIESPKIIGKTIITVASHQQEIINTLKNSGLKEGFDYITVFRSVDRNDS
ncbi:CDP-glycerol glycerophosphotransferase family protein [Bacillus sp. FJAT-29790]|uniref:CDP-glycerol glycerophosphotransferase family protein n=1 Tax=Bacillus sp. FJAT-29790 TaxID=1895002 RepID=UPI001C22E96B|nr:CDP-glycerol glycerophosphotransferase family protein [Bacillus sp. FJAT-29790]